MEVSIVKTRACFSCKGNNHDFTKEGFLKCPARDKICPKCGIKGHYKDTERCNNPRAAPSRVKKPIKPQNERQKLAEASEVEVFETSSIPRESWPASVMTAVAAK